jgi:GDP-mannose 6-dehydrogenase
VDGDIRDIIERHSDKSADSDFGICFQPEFLREGSSIQDYDNPPFTIVGTTSDRSAEMLRSLFGHLPCEFIVTDIGSAEIFGIDSRNVMDLLCRDHHLNISAAYLRPGFAFGGSCLPKDLRALMYMAKSKDISTPMLANVMTSNTAHLNQAIDVVLNSRARRVGIIGLSFKSGTDDLRESPLVAMAEHLIGKGIDLKIYDPQVNLSLLIGANKSYIEKHIPHIAAHLTNNCRDAVSGAEAIVVGADLPDAYKVIAAESRNDQLVLDLVGNLSPETIAGKYQGICW